MTLLSVRNWIADSFPNKKMFEGFFNIYLLFVCILTSALDSENSRPLDELHYSKSRDLTLDEKSLISYFAISVYATLWTLLLHKIIAYLSPKICSYLTLLVLFPISAAFLIARSIGGECDDS